MRLLMPPADSIFGVVSISSEYLLLPLEIGLVSDGLQFSLSLLLFLLLSDFNLTVDAATDMSERTMAAVKFLFFCIPGCRDRKTTRLQARERRI
jgi:hypothetical protein